jgi:hypothetical protein
MPPSSTKPKNEWQVLSKAIASPMTELGAKQQ